jgi:DNA-binding transcriptional MerR regulator
MTVMNSQDTLSLDQLAQQAGLPLRTVRYYIQLGLVDRPDGAGRGAQYARRHLEQLLLVQSLQRKGMTLEQVAEFSRREERGVSPVLPPAAGEVAVWSRLFLGEGLEMHVAAGRAGLTPEQVRSLFKGAMALVERVRREQP